MTFKAEFRPILRPVALAVTSLFLAACGGGGSDNDDPPAGAPTSISGTIVDGYIANAVVNCLNGDSVVATTRSDSTGKFAFNLGEGQGCDTIEALGGVDVGVTPNDPSDDIVQAGGVLRSHVPTGSTTLPNLVVSPLSTLVQALVDAGSSAQAAADQVKSSLGLPGGADLSTTDPTGDVTLYKANNVVAQLIGQIALALSAAGGVTDPESQQALASATINAIASNLSQASLATLAPSPDSLQPNSPLVAIITQAVQNVQADSDVGSTFAAVQPQTLALVAAPFVASATNTVNAAGSIEEIVASAGDIAELDRISIVVASVAPLLSNTASSAEQQVLLDALAAGIATSDSNSTDEGVTITIGGQTAPATVAGGLNNYVQVQGDTLALANGATETPVTLTQIESGVTVPQSLDAIRMVLQRSTIETQLTNPIEVPAAMQVVGAGRTFQAIIDRVTLQQGPNGTVLASVPEGAQAFVYAKSLRAETTTPVEMTLSGEGLQIVNTNPATNQIEFSFDNLFSAIAGSVAPGSALGDFAVNRVRNGTFAVTVVVGEVRVARNDPPELAGVQSVALTGSDRVVSGYGFQGNVTVTP